MWQWYGPVGGRHRGAESAETVTPCITWGSTTAEGGDNPPVPAVIGALQWYGLDLELLVEVGVAGVRTDTVEQTIADVDVIGDDSVMSK